MSTLFRMPPRPLSSIRSCPRPICAKGESVWAAIEEYSNLGLVPSVQTVCMPTATFQKKELGSFSMPYKDTDFMQDSSVPGRGVRGCQRGI